MTIYSFTPSMFLALLPEIGLIILGALILVLDLVWKGEQRRQIAWVTAIGLLLVGTLSVIFPHPSEQGFLLFGGMIRWDGLSWMMSLVFFFGGFITVLLARDSDVLGKEGEFYFLLVVSILGMCLMAAASDLVMLFLAIETTSIPLYILAGFFKRDEASTEAGFKYMLFGATTSAVMVYGFSLLYGFTGSTQLYDIGQYLAYFQIPTVAVVGIMILILVGLGFKIAAVPLHFWAPDVYQGAPTQVTGFLSTASKAAGFVALMRVFTIAFSNYYEIWSILIAILSVASMFFGNLQAMRQHNIKRLLAYSSIAQAGYILIGLASINLLGFVGVVFYLIAYMVTNLAAFGIISVVEKEIKSDEIADFAGLARRSSGLGLGLLAAFLSLAGIPPFAGFVGKIFLFSSAMASSASSWQIALVILGALNSIIALYYYLKVIKVVYQGEPGALTPIPMTRTTQIVLTICVVGILVVGVLFSPAFNWSTLAVSSLFQ